MQVETLAEATATRIVHGRLRVRTRGAGFTDLTPAVERWTGEIGAGDGLIAVFVSHTTASLTVQENADPDVLEDLLVALSSLAPRGASYRHTLEGPDDMPAHIRTMLSDCVVPMPLRAGRLALGTWQALYLIEHRDRGRDRTVCLTYVGS